MNDREARIKKIAAEFFQRTGLEFTISDFSTESEIARLRIESPESALLIGKHGATLEAIQYILTVILKNRIDPGRRLILDIGSYRQEKDENLKREARRRGEEVRRRGVAEEWSDLNAYQRRIVHLTLKDCEGVITESSGIEPERVIRIIPMTES